MTDPDDLESLLAPRPTPEPRPGFEATLFAQTERALARGRHLRCTGRAAVVAGVFGVGGLLGWGLRPVPPAPEIDPAVPRVEVVTVPVVVPVPGFPFDPRPQATGVGGNRYPSV